MDFSPIHIASLKKIAAQQGLPLSGMVDIAPCRELLSREMSHYEEWIQKKYHGAMAYLERGLEVRRDPDKFFPGAKSVFCVAKPYSAGAMGSSDSRAPRYARYMRGSDYHVEIKDCLEAVLQEFSEKFSLDFDQKLRWKICVDTSAVLERAWASFAGLGWIGKNGLLIHPQWGSYLLLGSAFLNQVSHCKPVLKRDLCGNCSRCLHACPTKAFVAPKVLDARQCISYLTLEKRGSFEIGEGEKIGNWLAGCDLCQEVCPFNAKRTKVEKAQEDPSFSQDWALLLEEKENDYRKRTKKTAHNRIKYQNFRRNLEQVRLNLKATTKS